MAASTRAVVTFTSEPFFWLICQHRAVLSVFVSAFSLATIQAETPETVLGRIKSAVESLLEKPQPPLFVRHLRSVLALSEVEVQKLRFATTRKDEQSKEVLGYLLNIDHGLHDDGDKAETYLKKGRRALTLAGLSKLDGSLQYCTVGLPPNFDPQKPYPFMVGLHGAGPTIPLAYVNFTFSPHGENERAPREIVSVVPWGRGNRGWRDDGETDLWEAVAEVQSIATLDPNHWYIQGHSMGADGVWALVQRTPDLWAAAGMQAGSTYALPVQRGLVANAAAVPFHIWIGDQDSNRDRIPSSQEARDALITVGAKPEFVLSPGVGHSPRGEDGDRQTDWMLTHTRKRPDHFAYIADTARHRGVWGIQILRPQGVGRAFNAMPQPDARIECWTDGPTVRIETKAVPRLSIDLGPSGLHLQGMVRVTVNGKEVHSGPVPSAPIVVNEP